jgi:tRNA1Val (adenine37-N6)-methyltransferase
MAKYLVKPTGTIAFIYHPVRLAEIFTVAAGLKLAPLRVRMVHGNCQSPARMFLVELAKGRRADLEVLPPLFVYEGNGEHSEEIKRILGELNA